MAASGIAFGLIEQLRAARPDARFLELVASPRSRHLGSPARRQAARRRWSTLHAALRDGGVDKRYRARAGPLARRAGGECARRCTSSRPQTASAACASTTTGRTAETSFCAAWRSGQTHDPPLALLEAELMTGRTHQIRVHLAHIGFTLAGDDKYGDSAWNEICTQQGLKRMFLHAHSAGAGASVVGRPMRCARIAAAADLAASCRRSRRAPTASSRERRVDRPARAGARRAMTH